MSLQTCAWLRACVHAWARASFTVDAWMKKQTARYAHGPLSVRLADQLAETVSRTCYTITARKAAYGTARVPFTFFGQQQQRMDQESGLARWLLFGPETINPRTSRLVPARGGQ